MVYYKAAGILAAALLACLTPSLSRAIEGNFPLIVEKVQAGTVMIEAKSKGETHLGSGFFLESPQVVITALHVVAGARRIRVVLPNTFLTSDALLVSGSPKWDIAVLRVAWPEELKFPGLRLSSEKDIMAVGTEVAYTGYGFGTGDAFVNVLSTYRGIISSRVPQGQGYLYHLSGFVNRGLSGSALYLPGSGEVIGVVTRHFGPTGLGMGFGGAVPSTVVGRIVEGIQR